MGSTLTLSLCSHPKVYFKISTWHRRLRGEALFSSGSFCVAGALNQSPTLCIRVSRSRKCLNSRGLVVRADSSTGRSVGSSVSRRAYRQSQVQAPASRVNEIASFVLPMGGFVLLSIADSYMETTGEIYYVKTS